MPVVVQQAAVPILTSLDVPAIPPWHLAVRPRSPAGGPLPFSGPGVWIVCPQIFRFGPSALPPGREGRLAWAVLGADADTDHMQAHPDIDSPEAQVITEE